MPNVSARNSSTAATICAFSAEIERGQSSDVPKVDQADPAGVIGTADSRRENANTANASAADTSCSETPM